jgi:acyl-[acyl-carrier-protein]-phospholipid O-acyltransferase / long-chain-fatty-acid--[acyl-carrier-protein] ligase
VKATKALEVVAMVLAIAALAAGRLEGLLVVLFLMATQSALFSPAKYGIVPELLPDLAISRANGLLEMSTFAAIVLGSALGGLMYAASRDTPAVIGIVLLAIAVVGLLLSLRIPRVPAARAAADMGVNPWAGLSHGFSRLRQDRALALAVLGVAYFWFLGALLQLLILLVGRQRMALDEIRIALMGAWLAIGIGAGSLAAGRLSGQKVELGLAPIGAFGMRSFALALALSSRRMRPSARRSSRWVSPEGSSSFPCTR